MRHFVKGVVFFTIIGSLAFMLTIYDGDGFGSPSGHLLHLFIIIVSLLCITYTIAVVAHGFALAPPKPSTMTVVPPAKRQCNTQYVLPLSNRLLLTNPSFRKVHTMTNVGIHPKV
ncbi:unnamed protein product [Umbelopsis ramanniana]